MKDVKYYILAYSMLIYLFLEKYMALLYLLCKIHFIDNNKNVEDGTDAFYFVDAFQEVMFDAYFLKE